MSTHRADGRRGPVTTTTELFVNDTGTIAIYGGAGVEIGEKSPFRDIRRRISRNRKGRPAS